jgi:hypothetical protein
MQGNVLSGLWKIFYPIEAESKADLTSKMEIRMEFGSFPIFLGNRRASGMGIGIFGVVSKTFCIEALST